MKTTIATSILILICAVAAGLGQNRPNYVMTTAYFDASKSSTATAFVDGLGRTVQTRTELAQLSRQSTQVIDFSFPDPYRHYKVDSFFFCLKTAWVLGRSRQFIPSFA